MSTPPLPARPDATDPPKSVAANTVDLIRDALRGSAQGVAQDGAPAEKRPAGHPACGDVIAGYRLVRLLGRGGMAEVYEAIQLRLRRPVALKLLIIDEERRELAPRFLREARAMMQVRHGNLTTIHDAGRIEGLHYLAMELIPGGDLAQRINRDGALPVDEAVRLMIGCCDGMAALHAAGLVHRDIKPGNIFLDADGEPKIGDFGLARQTSGADRMTVTGSAWGTPSYMAPEQIVGAADVDARADIYALGATFYTMVTGREPFSGETAYLATFKAMTEPFPDPRALNPAVPAALATIIRMATELERSRRYSSARSMREDLERAARQAMLLHAGTVSGGANTVTAPFVPPPTSRPATPPTRPLPRSRGWSGVAFGFALLGIVGWWSQRAPAASPTFPVWATAGGNDGFGRWVEITVADATTRLRYRPAGTFRMGSPIGEPGRLSNENEHTVTISRGFWMQETECDQAFYHAVMRENPSRHRGVQLPVEQVAWHDAQAFCAALHLHGAPARLPSEAEWEYACRAGSTSPFAGPEVTTMGWVAPDLLRVQWQLGEGAARRWCEEHQDDLRLRARPIGRRLPNGAGFFDLHGNVLEWCADHWDGRTAHPSEERIDPLSSVGDFAVARGGSWFHEPQMARSAARMALETNRREDHLGFRFVIPDQKDAVVPQ
ncbi:MAG: SUMF1/EgtB/PvdO family nonheme iron enzyme [Planctomycetes bacterium]|nr:SUMF1/EgtB/PvdO family nonheme iron enzyme [Planctomycetota bacterium]